MHAEQPWAELDVRWGGKGKECRTIAPYNPYSAIMELWPQHFSFFRHFARRFWNQTWRSENKSYSNSFGS